ncbi:ATP-binding cassette domain-containing protein, partial [Kibdelosporangium lantanae]
MITTTELTKRYGSTVAVNAVSLTVREGDRYGFLGPNGSGKTTLVRMLLGLVYPTSGTVRVMDQPIPGRARSVLPLVGSLIEAPAAYPYLSGRRNLALYVHLGFQPTGNPIVLPDDGPKLFAGSSVGIRLVNGQPQSYGNDSAVDNIRILDVTPQLDKTFAPAHHAQNSAGPRTTPSYMTRVAPWVSAGKISSTLVSKLIDANCDTNAASSTPNSPA